jgi:hypothetical protein
VLIENVETEIQEETTETVVTQVVVIEIETVAVTEIEIVETKIAAAATRTENDHEMTKSLLLADQVRVTDLREREVLHRTLFTKRREPDGIRCRRVSRSSLNQQSLSLLLAQYLTTSTHKLSNKSVFISATCQLKFRMTS